MNSYLKNFFEQSKFYEFLADNLDNNPLLSLDYLRRAFLISGDESIKEKVAEICEGLVLHERAKNSVESLLVDF